MKSTSLYLLFFLLLFAGFSSCKTGEDTPKDTFDRAAWLTHTANAIILPAYEQMKNRSEALQTALQSFSETPNNTTLASAQNAWKAAALQWQEISAFEFGPAETALLTASCYTFPADIALIETNISTGSYSLETVAAYPAKGFACLEYLLFNGSSTEIINAFNESEARKAYVLAVENDLHQHLLSVWNQWQAGYLSQFPTLTGNDVGSAMGLLVNRFNYQFEFLKNQKLGIPLGKKTLGTPQPERVEAPYSKYSNELLKANMNMLYRLYRGKTVQGTEGLGMHSYLLHLKTPYAGGLLAETIDTQFIIALQAVEAIPSPLSEAVQNSSGPAQTAYIELQKLVVLLKSDMPSALGVLITYQDNDGD